MKEIAQEISTSNNLPSIVMKTEHSIQIKIEASLANVRSINSVYINLRKKG